MSPRVSCVTVALRSVTDETHGVEDGNWGDDDQVVPCEDASVLAVKLVQNRILKIYPGFSQGMAITEAETVTADLLKFIES